MDNLSRLPVGRCNRVLRMTRDEFNSFCDGLTATTHVVQWGNADVWKVGGKVFAICGWNDGAIMFIRCWKVTGSSGGLNSRQTGQRAG